MHSGTRVGYVCANCGSSNVTSDAIAKWDSAKQQWTVAGHYDSSECRRCQCETHLVEVELALQPQA